MKIEELKLCVLFGGESSEHEVSGRSAVYIIELLRSLAVSKVYQIGISKEGEFFLFYGPIEDIFNSSWINHPAKAPVYFKPGQEAGFYCQGPGQYSLSWHPVDVFLPILHGKRGEDGTIQGLLDMIHANYIGCKALASAVGMDKVVSQQLFDQAGIPQAAWTWLSDIHYRQDKLKSLEGIEDQLTYPMFIKPANAGSSVGISKAKTRSELEAALDLAFVHDSKAVVEEAIIGREIELAVLENPDLKSGVFVSQPGEIIPDKEFYDYESKYISQSARLLVPALVTDREYTDLKEYAIKAFNIINGSGLSRVDFFIEEASGRVLINEINTMPGFTSISMYPKLMTCSGYSAQDLIKSLIRLALK